MSVTKASEDTSSGKLQASPRLLEIAPYGDHLQTFIILHGRGSTAQKFADPLLTQQVAPQGSCTTTQARETFQEHFPHAKFVFPTAPLRRAVIYNRSLTHQWFDNWELDKPEYREELQIEGLRDTCDYVHSLLQAAIDDVGAENVILMGLSQGCAASLIALLLWQGPPIKAFVGMCGWLPFRQVMQEVIDGYDTEHDDIFERQDDNDADNESIAEIDGKKTDKLDLAVQCLRDELDLELLPGTTTQGIRGTSILLTHGHDDEKVPCELGRLASSLLQETGLQVEWRVYDDLGHWYSAVMLRHIVNFLDASVTTA